MVNVEQFMNDYNTLKTEISNETDKAKNAILNLANMGYNLNDNEMKSMVDVLVAKAIGQAKYDTLKFYENYIVPDVDTNATIEVENDY